MKALKNQLGIRKRMEHPQLLKIFYLFENKKALKVVTELFNGKRVKQFLSLQESNSEDKKFFIFFQIALGVEALHSMKMQIADLNVNLYE